MAWQAIKRKARHGVESTPPLSLGVGIPSLVGPLSEISGLYAPGIAGEFLRSFLVPLEGEVPLSRPIPFSTFHIDLGEALEEHVSVDTSSAGNVRDGRHTLGRFVFRLRCGGEFNASQMCEFF